MMKYRVEVWTDGACRGNGSDNSLGGCGVVLLCKGKKKELKSAQRNTTNNAQEIRAVLLGLRAITDKGSSNVEVFSDSAYVVNCMNAKWYIKWRANGWRTAKQTPVENKQLWIELLNEIGNFDVITFAHIKGHCGIGYNERCDELANQAMNEFLDAEGTEVYE